MSKAKNALKVADRYLLNPYGLGNAELEKVFRKLMRHDIDHADLYFQYHRGEAWSLEEGIVKAGSFDIEQGVGVRAVSGEKTAFAYSDDISLDALVDAATATRAIAAAGRRRKVAISPAKARRRLYRDDDPLDSLDDTAKVRLLERLEGFARAEDARVSQVMAHLAGSWEVVLVARADGARVTVVEPHPGRRRLAAEAFGLAVADAAAEDAYDLVLECVGVEAALRAGVLALRKGATLLVVGVHGHDACLPMGLVQDRELRLQGTLMYQSRDFARALELMTAGGLDLAPMIGARFPLARAAEAYALAAGGGDVLKVLLVP